MTATKDKPDPLAATFEELRLYADTGGGKGAMSCSTIAAVMTERQNLIDGMLAYLSEFDNPVPDALHRRQLRDHLRTLTGAPRDPKDERR